MAIPGSSKCVKLIPFHQKNLPKDRNFTYLEDPGIQKGHVGTSFVFPWFFRVSKKCLLPLPDTEDPLSSGECVEDVEIKPFVLGNSRAIIWVFGLSLNNNSGVSI